MQRVFAFILAGFAVTFPFPFFHISAAVAALKKAIFGYGYNAGYVSVSNLVSTAGVVANDTTGVGTARTYVAAAAYGGDKGIFGFGFTGSVVSMTNLVSNTGVIATDTTGVGTARYGPAAASYGTNTAIFAYGISNTAPTTYTSVSNLVSNTGVVATDTAGVGTGRYNSGATSYG